MSATALHRCPSPEALAEAYEGGGTLAVHQHVDACSACAAEWRAFESLSELGRELPKPVRSAAQVEQVRTVLLAAAQQEWSENPRATAVTRSSLRAARWAVPLAAAASLVAVLALKSGVAPENEVHRGRVSAATAARLTHSTKTSADGSVDEVVRLTDGRVRVAVEKLHAKERFRVVLGNAEIEVHGTEFEVAAEQDRLTAVFVHEGVVEVRPRGAQAVRLMKGQSWPVKVAAVVAPPELAAPTPASAPVAEAAVPAVEAPKKVASRRRSSPVAAPAAAQLGEVPEVPALPLPEKAGLLGGATEEAFAAGWQALRQGDAAAAARSFASAAESAPQTALAEDARFWEAVALARAGQARSAARAMESYLERYPSSARAGELSAMLGWLLLDDGRTTEAQRRFNAALADPSAKVRQSAQAGLAEIAGR